MDVVRPVERLAEHRGRHRSACAMRHRTDEGGNRGKRRGLAFPPANMASGRDAHDEGVLAAVRSDGDLRHGEIEKVYTVDLHETFLVWRRMGFAGPGRPMVKSVRTPRSCGKAPAAVRRRCLVRADRSAARTACGRAWRDWRWS